MDVNIHKILNDLDIDYFSDFFDTYEDSQGVSNFYWCPEEEIDSIHKGIEEENRDAELKYWSEREYLDTLSRPLNLVYLVGNLGDYTSELYLNHRLDPCYKAYIEIVSDDVNFSVNTETIAIEASNMNGKIISELTNGTFLGIKGYLKMQRQYIDDADLTQRTEDETIVVVEEIYLF
ncbi:MAG: hypothetical protein IM585_23950 [Pseudanabaena sp. M135S2SP2A07QC]|jgi:hypothetical protein|nr:hypothetical protein [Pseudanabaena sp. M179S2SP2A07QC]MCA6532208.1 hypothetical protein [Pseudanabaena sp. M125S2SP2A07QC]MCA6536146.1 hypothetical protein [Pseudanabaena sp. M176S2SP2A07QC]MCA6541359.1 hypothetical protein [Pseudanabaena sp. M037S2SP2A07QC]MCA6548659.1 hypothetical protein [Pseudanabaena sp. M152S2SP2A07QC]MCA6554924.1 hypothetical protein [Pseudanabaena sp. M135S2SP2A07QC]MCA6565626.1 hypothetical protein [Pseudanabaena sp. M151S2SP2A07QC]MCA6568931.1 hypothetical prot